MSRAAWAAAGVIAAGGIGLAIGLAAGKKTPPPGASLTISATPTSLPDTGGTVTISGTATGLADGTVLTLLVNGKAAASGPLSGPTFTFTYVAPPNTGTTRITDTLQVTAA